MSLSFETVIVWVWRLWREINATFRTIMVIMKSETGLGKHYKPAHRTHGHLGTEGADFWGVHKFQTWKHKINCYGW
jgi:hypothetical protein